MCFFLEGHEYAFNLWNGIPKNLLYDNLKSVVKKRVHAEAIEFNPVFLEFAKHHRFRPRPVGVRKGNEKGRVERAIRYIRSSFFMARKFKDIEDLNQQALEWCQTVAMERSWQDDDRINVQQSFEKEKGLLLPLRENPFPGEEKTVVSIGKTPFARFDLNDYSVPHSHVRKKLVVFATSTHLRIFDGDELVASHKRSFDRRKTILEFEHFEGLKNYKRLAQKARRTGLLQDVVPASDELFKQLAKKGAALGHATRQMEELLFAYGASAVEKAVNEVLLNGSPHPAAVRHVLERDRIQHGEKAAIPLSFHEDSRLKTIGVTPHSLAQYDKLSELKNDSEVHNND